MFGLVGSTAWCEPSPPGAPSNATGGTASRPVAEIDPPAAAAVILNRSVRPERRARVELDVVELRAGRRHRERPRLAAVGRLVEAAVVGVVDDVGVRRIDPQPVMIAVHALRDARAKVLPPSVDVLSGTPRM